MTDIWLYGNPMWVMIVIMTLRKRYENPYCNELLSNYEGITLVSLINKSWGTSIITRWRSAWIDQRFRIPRQFQLRQLIVVGEIRSHPPTLISTHMSLPFVVISLFSAYSSVDTVMGFLLFCVFPVGPVSNLSLTFSLGFSPDPYPPYPPHRQIPRGKVWQTHASIPLL